MKTKLIPILLCLVFIVSLCACNESDYKNDVSSKDIADAIVTSINDADGFTSPDSDFVEFNMEGVSALCEDYTVMLSTVSININEFGIFRTKSEKDAEQIAALCQKYIDQKVDSYMNGPQYLPEEYPKIQNASVKVYGCYVVYTVLTDANTSTVDSVVLEKLAK